MLSDTQPFRCPFEVQAEKANRILTIPFEHHRNNRIPRLRQAFKDFHERKRVTEKEKGRPEVVFDFDALSFLLPLSLSKIKSFEELGVALAPYWHELMGAEIEFRLFPFLPQHPSSEVDWDHLNDIQHIYLHVAHVVGSSLSYSLTSHKCGPTFGVVDWVRAQGLVYEMFHPTIVTAVPLMRMQPGAVIFDCDNYLNPNDPVTNRNLFALVKCPLYDPEVGRFDKRVQIIYSRQADFNKLDKPTRRNIRVLSNTILQQHGIPIHNVEEYRLPPGLWIPPR